MKKCLQCGSDNIAENVDINIKNVDGGVYRIDALYKRTGILSFINKKETIKFNICRGCGNVQLSVDTPERDWIIVPNYRQSKSE